MIRSLERQSRRPVRRRGDARGLTLVELIVAVMVFSVGILGLASTAGVLVRQMGDGARQTIAAQAAASRFERLRSIPCTTIASGQATGRSGVSESWVKTASPRSVIVTDTVKYDSPGKKHAYVYRSVIPCPTLP
jgi:prepilin-type N-terminal cleavage/methylation domain-containing protein